MRPLKVGELIDRGLRIYQRNGLMFLRNSAVPALLCVAALAIVQNFVLPNMAQSKAGAQQSEQIATAAIGGAAALLFGAPLFIFGLSWMMGFSCVVSLESLCGRQMTEEDAVKETNANLGRMLKCLSVSLFKAWSVMLVSGVLLLVSGVVSQTTSGDDSSAGVLAGLGVCGIAVGFIFWVVLRMREALVPAIVMFENLDSPNVVIKRSHDLLKGNRYHGVGTDAVGNGAILLLLLFGLFIGSAYTGAEMIGLQGFVNGLFGPGPARSLVNTGLEVLPWYFAIWTLIPAWGAVTSAIYFDRRIRLDGLDIDTLASFAEVGSRG